ncbi:MULTISPECIES: site-specific integrase [Pontibacillus]|uniref:DNA integrase n=1 Tax=Pontibacillus marinus BH030004 = DSM 16465 TaxID=1385511 RepID=A0A0A5FU62_9BACI|nr:MULTISPECIES: tyrosine-type recombinase/integrase [Pontibacillus]KGX84321.1 DNA integrase [Pontibacillus marinus BH030004 = DSM 16465]QHE50864.1 tyrosine-type recombinase/integrase [Pontibacillus sp. HMF3514]
MKGHFYRRGCKCKKKKCTCGSKWAFTIDIGIDPITGKRKQKTKSGFNTEQEAEAAAAALIHEVNEGTYLEESDKTFSEFTIEWLPIYSDSKDVKPGTIRVRLHEIGKLLPYFAQLKLKDITRKMYQDALNDLKEQGYSDSTREGINRTGRMIFRKALELELIKKDPTEFAYVKKDKKTIEQLEEEEVPKYLEKEELALFLETAGIHGLEHDDLVFLILAYTGIRVGELVALKWKDVDFKNHTISITKTYYNPNNNALEYQLLPPKTRKSRRKIVVDEDVINALKEHKKVQNKVIEQLGNDYYNQDFIFAKMERQFGYPIVIKNVRDHMKRLLKIAGLNEDLTPHSLRHTHTSLLAEAGVSLEQIMDRLGHTDDQTTKNVYLHVTQEMKKEASQKFSELMRSLR